MKGTALTKLESRQWVLFGARVVGEGRDEYVDALAPLEDRYAELGLHSVFDASTWELEVDYAQEGEVQRALEEATAWVAAVEARCPWAARFGVEGTGEGIVFTPLGPHWGRTDLFFKVKGAKHKKVKSPRAKVQVAPEVLAGIEAFVSFSTTEARLEQGVDVLRERTLPLDLTSLGEFLKWVSQDVRSECAVELEASGLTWKQVNKAVTTRARTWFLERAKSGQLD